MEGLFAVEEKGGRRGAEQRGERRANMMRRFLNLALTTYLVLFYDWFYTYLVFVFVKVNLGKQASKQATNLKFRWHRHFFFVGIGLFDWYLCLLACLIFFLTLLLSTHYFLVPHPSLPWMLPVCLADPAWGFLSSSTYLPWFFWLRLPLRYPPGMFLVDSFFVAGKWWISC